MRHLACLLVVLAFAAAAAKAAPPPRPAGLPGLGDPGRLGAEAKAAAFELQVLERLNQARAGAKAAPLSMDERLRAFARREAERAARDGKAHV